MHHFKPRRHRDVSPPQSPLLDALESRLLLGADPFPSLALMENQSNPVMRLETGYGPIDLEVLANRGPGFATAYIDSFNSPSRQQTVFHNAVPGYALEAGQWSYLADDTTFGMEFAGQLPFPALTGDNLARTVTALARHEFGPPFSQYFSEAFYFNLVDNAPPAAPGDYAVVARVLGDASWSVVQTIAGLSTVDFGDGAPFPNRHYNTPVTGAWNPGDPIPPELLVQITDATLIKAQDAPDYYRNTIYSAEGFTGSTISEFVPIENPNDQAAYVEVRARYEAIPERRLYQRDQLIARTLIDPHSRGGITVSTIDTWANAAVQAGVPYAIELRSTLPVAAMLSHYDFGSASGESLTNQTSTTWSFAGLGARDDGVAFLVWDNPSQDPVTLTLTLRGHAGESTFDFHYTLLPHRRGGIALESLNLPDSHYSAVLEASAPVLAQISYYERPSFIPEFIPGGYGALGNAGAPSTVGVIPLAFLPSLPTGGFPSPNAQLTVFNPGTSTVTVDIDIYQPGPAAPAESFPGVLSVDPGDVQVFQFLGVEGDAPGPVTLVYHATGPVHAALSMRRVDDLYASQVGISAALDHHFADGFTNPARTGQNVLEEHLMIFNPYGSAFGVQQQDTTVTITFRYTDGFTFSHQEFIRGGGGAYVDISGLQEVIDQANQNGRFFYSLEVSSPIAVLAEFLHTDTTLGDAQRLTGGFATLGTVFGSSIRLDQLPPR